MSYPEPATMTDEQKRLALQAMQACEACYSHSYPPDALAGGPSGTGGMVGAPMMGATSPGKARKKAKGSVEPAPSPDPAPVLADEPTAPEPELAPEPEPEPVAEPAPEPDAPKE